MRSVWVIVANATHCKIYDYQKQINQLTLHKNLNHFESKLKTQELSSDYFGSMQTNGSASGVYECATNPKEWEKIEFAKQIAKELETARHRQQYDGLFIIAEPHFHGLIGKQLNKNVDRMVLKDIQRDYLDYDEEKLQQVVEANRSKIPIDD